jgi:hypothetical protein
MLPAAYLLFGASARRSCTERDRWFPIARELEQHGVRSGGARRRGGPDPVRRERPPGSRTERLRERPRRSHDGEGGNRCTCDLRGQLPLHPRGASARGWRTSSSVGRFEAGSWCPPSHAFDKCPPPFASGTGLRARAGVSRSRRVSRVEERLAPRTTACTRCSTRPRAPRLAGCGRRVGATSRARPPVAPVLAARRAGTPVRSRVRAFPIPRPAAGCP